MDIDAEAVPSEGCSDVSVGLGREWLSVLVRAVSVDCLSPDFGLEPVRIYNGVKSRRCHQTYYIINQFQSNFIKCNSVMPKIWPGIPLLPLGDMEVCWLSTTQSLEDSIAETKALPPLSAVD